MAAPIVKLVADLYGCLSLDNPESAALDVLCSSVGAAHAIVMRSGSASGDMLATSHHLAAVPLDHVGGSDEYRHLIRTAGNGSVVRMTEMMPRENILRTDMYQTTLRTIDGGLAAYGLQHDGADLVVAAICRSAAHDPDFDEASVSLFRAALPHLVAVTGIAGRIRRERQGRNYAFDALDIVDDGIILIGSDGTLLHVNRTADALLTRANRIRRTPSGIAAADRLDDARLQQAIHAIRTQDGTFDDAAKATALAKPCRIMLGRGRPGWPLIVSVAPARGTLTRDSPGRAIVIHLSDPGGDTCLSIATLRTELGLTAREATLTERLGHGATLVEAARAMDISVATVRQYLKTIFHKAGVHSQGDLLKIVRR